MNSNADLSLCLISKAPNSELSQSFSQLGENQLFSYMAIIYMIIGCSVANFSQ